MIVNCDALLELFVFLGLAVYRKVMSCPGDASESEMRRIIGVRAQVLGAEHATTLKTMSKLGTLLRDQGRLKEAGRIFEHVVNTRQRLWDVDIELQDNQKKLVSVYKRQGAHDLADQVIAIATANSNRRLASTSSLAMAGMSAMSGVDAPAMQASSGVNRFTSARGLSNSFNSSAFSNSTARTRTGSDSGSMGGKQAARKPSQLGSKFSPPPGQGPGNPSLWWDGAGVGGAGGGRARRTRTRAKMVNLTS